MAKTRITKLYENYKKDYFQKIIEFNGHKFQYKVEATNSTPCATIGNDWYNSLSIMDADGKFHQIQDAKSVNAPYSHYSLTYHDFERQKEMVEEIFKCFDAFVKSVYK